MQKKYLTKEQAIQKLRQHCAYQERSHSEVQQKLWDLGVARSEHDEIISSLIVDDYLNEERFAKQFAGGKFRIKDWGKKRISLYDEKLNKNITLGNENIRSLKTWKKILASAGFKIREPAVEYIRFIPPPFIKETNEEDLIQKERQIAKKFGFLKAYFYFGINFTSYKT